MGTRLRPLTENIPKCMVPIAGKPLLAYWLEILVDIDITDILINTHYLPETVKTFIDNSPFKEKVTLVYEAELLHTGGTLLKNKSFFKKEPFFVIHADNFSVCDYRQFITAHQNRPEQTIATMMTFTTETPESCGIVSLDAQGIVTDFFEKVINPPSNLANGAVYIFEPEIFDYLTSVQERQKTNKIDLSNDIISRLMGKIFSFHNDQCHIDIGTIKQYQLACEYAKEHITE